MSGELSDAVREQIQKLMTARGMGPSALAQAAGIPQSSMSRKLSAQARFDLDDVQRIAGVFGVEAADVVAWAERSLKHPPNE